MTAPKPPTPRDRRIDIALERDLEYLSPQLRIQHTIPV